MFTLLIVIVYLDFLTIHHELHPLLILSSHTHPFIYLPFLPHSTFHIPIPTFLPALILSYTHTFLSSRTYPFIYLPFLAHSYFHITSFPLKFNLFISTHTFLSYHTHCLDTFLSSHGHSHPWIHLTFIPHSSFHINPFFFPPHTLIQPFLTSSSFSSFHNHPTFPKPILFSFL